MASRAPSHSTATGSSCCKWVPICCKVLISGYSETWAAIISWWRNLRGPICCCLLRGTGQAQAEPCLKFSAPVCQLSRHASWQRKQVAQASECHDGAGMAVHECTLLIAMINYAEGLGFCSFTLACPAWQPDTTLSSRFSFHGMSWIERTPCTCWACLAQQLMGFDVILTTCEIAFPWLCYTIVLMGHAVDLN